jgi:hypothetical protein
VADPRTVVFINTFITMACGAFCGYQIGKLRGWERGFKEGDAMGFRFGRAHGRMEMLVEREAALRAKPSGEGGGAA